MCAIPITTHIPEYREQLDRVRRFFARTWVDTGRTDVQYQDDTWAFFQNCWHLKDWIKNDQMIPQPIRDRVVKAAHVSLPKGLSGDG
jgi:hypothetical protein